MNGERNGKGKEYDYWNGKLIFEGEYLNGERNGKGKEYYYHSKSDFGNDSSKLKFEGEYLNGKIWNGIFYDLKSDDFNEIKNVKGFIKEYDK